MKGFAIFILVLCVISALLGLAMSLLGNGAEEVQGATYLGSGITGILLSCVVIALTDIRTSLQKKVD
jgi:hypothetical protein